jgi:transcription elongation factor GreA
MLLEFSGKIESDVIEFENMPNVNSMTEETQHYLQSELKRIKESLTEAGRKMGEAFGPDCDWHDNSAADFAVEEYKRIGVREAELQSALQNAIIIKPRQEIDHVDLGNTVVVRLGDSDEDEKFTLLGPQDAATGRNNGWISYLSPVGEALMGMREGESRTFPLGENRKQSVAVKKILPGEFGDDRKD